MSGYKNAGGILGAAASSLSEENTLSFALSFEDCANQGEISYLAMREVYLGGILGGVDYGSVVLNFLNCENLCPISTGDNANATAGELCGRYPED